MLLLSWEISIPLREFSILPFWKTTWSKTDLLNKTEPCRLGWKVCNNHHRIKPIEKSNCRENGCSLVDSFRVIHPSKRNAYTCFCNKFGGRATNFGSRIDYIFCDESLKASITHSDILNTMKGSDHLPVVTGMIAVERWCVELDFSLQSSSHSQGLMQFIKAQSTIDSFFTKKSLEEGKQSRKREITLVSQNIQEIKEDEWICDRCTLINSISIQYCEACGSKRQTKRKALEVGIDTLLGKGKEKIKQKVPLCLKHKIPCARHQGNDFLTSWFLVLKEGKNKGRFFYSCSLPIGFSNDPMAKCNFFLWEEDFK